MKERREAWFEGQLDLDPEKLIFIDETWTKTNMARKCGRAPRRAAARQRPARPLEDDDLSRRLAPDRNGAPMVLDGPINGVWFQAYVEQVLVPTLAPGDIVIMDNLGSHKGAGRAQGHRGRRARSCSTFRHTVPTSIQSRTPSRN